MSIPDALIIITVGFIAGAINTVAGGGSLITLPMLIFMGLPSPIANATNRIAIFSQNIFAVTGFKSKGVFVFPYALWLGISALIGAIIGAHLAIDVSDRLFNRILSVVMILVLISIIAKPGRENNDAIEKLDLNDRIISIVIFFFIGIYGGFIQAGVGFLILAALTNVNNINLVKSNSIKVFVILFYSVSAITVFIINDQIDWLFGLVLAVGNSLGGWFMSRWSVKKGDRWIRYFLIIVVSIMAIKLWLL
ncbi:MAG TPA: sulfite exporter TauE/SafE family protein [Cyclobacteriaceae bacterium]